MRTAIAFVLLYVAFDRLATALGSLRGEAGLVVAIAIVGLIVVVQRGLTRRPTLECLRMLGLRVPTLGAACAAVVLSAAFIAAVPRLADLLDVEPALRDNAVWLAIGIFAQGGVTEEVLFRGFMYRHLRSSRTFTHAAALSAVPFAIAHVPLVWSLDLGLALLAIAVSILSAFPFAWLFDRAHGSIWPGALVHAVMQGGIKLIADDADFARLGVAWTALSLALPWSLFLLRPRSAFRDDTVSEHATDSNRPGRRLR